VGDGRERLPLEALGGSLAGDGFVWLHRGLWGHVGDTAPPAGWLLPAGPRGW